MLAVLSPAKRLDFETPPPPLGVTQPRLADRAAELAEAARAVDAARWKTLMKLSDPLAERTARRFAAFEPAHHEGNAKPAIHAFQGDVYQGLDAASLGDAAITHAQTHIRILSGLYGVLRPLDLMQPYRLEMGTRFGGGAARDLYGFWGGDIADVLADDLREAGGGPLVNLASREYVKAVDRPRLDAAVLDVDFRELRDGEPRIIAFHAKRARGMMARFICENGITDAAGMKDFSTDGYRFRADLSTDDRWVFLRPDSRG